MKPEDSVEELRKRAQKVPPPAVPLDVLIRNAREVATGIRQLAAARHDTVRIRVVAKDRGVRITIVGRHAGRYRDLARTELARRVPNAAAEVRAQTKGK